jgi:protoheme ferro-lyase
VLVVFMGMASGGMLALMLMAARRQQITFSIALALSVVLALFGLVSASASAQNTVSGLVNAGMLLILSFALGYTLTTFSVLSSRKQPAPIAPSEARDRKTAVICLARGEPPEYDTESAAAQIELAGGEGAGEVPPVLLRPFHMRRLKGKYASIGRSPYREYMVELAHKVQARLEGSYRVYPAFSADHPSLAEAVRQAVEDGASSILVAHICVTDPPESVKSAGMDHDALALRLAHLDPLWESDLLPQIYVRRMLEAVPQVDIEGEGVGLLLVGHGSSTATEAGSARHEQEHHLQRKVRRALLRLGFDESRVAVGWLHEAPTIGEALLALRQAGCKSIYWIPFSFPADGITTLHDIPNLINSTATSVGLRFVPLGGWNADELAAEEIAGRIRAAYRVPAGRAL